MDAILFSAFSLVPGEILKKYFTIHVRSVQIYVHVYMTCNLSSDTSFRNFFFFFFFYLWRTMWRTMGKLFSCQFVLIGPARNRWTFKVFKAKTVLKRNFALAREIIDNHENAYFSNILYHKDFV